MNDPVTVPTFRLSDALAELPLFPLPEITLFPRAILPLHIFEPRYRTMLREALRTHGAMGVVQMERPRPEGYDDPPKIARIAGAGLVIEHEPLPDGRFNILVQGMARVALEELPFVSPYRRARATILEDEDVLVPEGEVAALVQLASAFASEVRKRDARFSFRLPEASAPGTMADICAFHLVIDADVRQAVLEDLNPRTRVERVIEELSTQRAELEPVEKTIAN